MKKFIEIKPLLLIIIKLLNIIILNVASFRTNIKTSKCEIFYVNVKEIFYIIYERKYFKELTLEKIKKKLIKCILFK